MFYTGSLTVRTRRHHPMPQLQERHLRRHHNLSRRQWQTSFIKPFWILRNYSGEPWLEHPVRMSLRCLWGQILRIRSDMDWNWMKEWSKRQSRTILPWVPRIHLAAKELYFQGNTESLTMLQGVPKKVGFTTCNSSSKSHFFGGSPCRILCRYNQIQYNYSCDGRFQRSS